MERIQEGISKVVSGQSLSYDEMKPIFTDIMEGRTTEAQIASFLTALRMKGETIDEITACASVLREVCMPMDTGEADVLDIVGTGGDGAGSINISTISSFVIAAGGAKVGKHGNRSMSSKCGSADCLESLGVNLKITPERNIEILSEIGICFMFAQTYHAAMKYAAPVRKQIGIRTIFNVLGPLANPARAKLQVLGVYDESLAEPLAHTLKNLGVKRAAVIHGSDGLDEATVCGETYVHELKDGEVTKYTVTPEQVGLKLYPEGALKGGSPEENAETALKILKGEERGAKRDAVVLNSAIGLYVSELGQTLAECVKKAEELIDSGAALEKLESLVRLSNEPA